MAKVIKLILFLITFPIAGAFSLKELSGQDMSSQNYQLQGGNFNTSSSAKSSSGFRLEDLVGQTSAQIFTSKGYLLNSGGLNTQGSGLITFSLEPSIINFGTMTPDKEFNHTVVITVANGDLPGYFIYAAQDHPLTTEAGAQIPNTVCDLKNGKTCTKDKSSTWTEKNSFGLGFTLKGNNILSDMKTPGFFRPFPSLDFKDQPTLIVSSNQKKASDTVNLELKIAVPKSQPVGIYQNTLNFALFPGY